VRPGQRDPEMELLRQHRAAGMTLTAGALEKLDRYEKARALNGPLHRSVEDAMADQAPSTDRAIASMNIAQDDARDRMAVARRTEPAAFAALPLGERLTQLTYERAQELAKGAQS
jgi:hypothetical protein